MSIEQAIRDNLAGPRRAQGDSGSVEQHSLQDMIAADKYLAQKAAASRTRGLPFRVTRIIPPGSI